MMVANFLLANESASLVRGGAGDALSLAMCDMRPVIGVEWHALSLSGVAGLAGAVHSLLAITVGNCNEDLHCCDTYVIEKAAQVQLSNATHHGSLLCENGVYVSRWCDVMPNVVNKPLHSLDIADIANNTGKQSFCVRTLCELAVELGPYNAADCNCHHAALALYNACAKKDAQVSDIPNQDLMVVPWLVNLIGLDLGPVSSLAITR